MKKILVFSLAYRPFIGGAEIATEEIIKQLGDFQFDIITMRFDKKLPKFETFGNARVYRIGGPKLFFPFTAFFKALKLNKENRHDLAWAIMANRAGFAAMFFKLFKSNIPFVLTLQEGDDEIYPFKRMGILLPFLYPFWKLIFAKADCIQVISNYLADWAKRMGAKCELEVVPNGVDTRQFSIFNFQFSNNLKNELKIKNEDKVIITTSRLVEKNGVGDVITAMKYLPENYKFLVLGDGPKMKNYSSLVARYSFQNRVKLLGNIDQKEIPDYLAISDVFVRPSLSEGLGNSFLEAMAAGVPVIGTKVGGVPDFLTQPEIHPNPPLSKEGTPPFEKGRLGGISPTGLFCGVNNPKDIAEKVKFILDPKNAELKNKIIANAKKLVEEKYDWNLIAGEMREIFEKIH